MLEGGILNIPAWVEHDGNEGDVHIPKGCLPVSPPSPTVRKPMDNCQYIYLVLQASVAPVPGVIDRVE